MGKKLSEMTLKELWELFPIFLTEHKNCWKDYYCEMEERIRGELSEVQIVRISHIGSTAIDNIQAKDIVDILLEVSKSENLENVARAIESIGFIKMSSTERRYSFNWGYTEKGFADKVYHLHLRYDGDNDELYFRDYMNENPLYAKEYERLKLDLWKKYEHDRDGYTNAKAAFVKKYTSEAKEKYPDRYKQPRNCGQGFKERAENLKREREDMNMEIESRCGLLCSECSFREAMGCKGCVNMDKPFWADSCPVKSCCEEKEHKHCGECDNFVCPVLHTFAYDMEQSDNGKRIEQCKKWKK